MKINEIKFEWAGGLSPRKTTNKIVLHHAAALSASVEAIHRAHLANGWAGIGYHFYVRKDGSVYRGRPEEMIGAHSRGHNSNSIGICFEGNYETEEKMPETQKSAGENLLGYLEEKYGKIELCLHRELLATACPGKYFPVITAKAELPEVVENKPSDLPDYWAKKACDWAVTVGLISGDGSGNYNWRHTLTKQEMAILLYKFKEIQQ